MTRTVSIDGADRDSVLGNITPLFLPLRQAGSLVTREAKANFRAGVLFGEVVVAAPATDTVDAVLVKAE